MRCAHIIQKDGLMIKCDIKDYCPYQYWCNKDREYKSTATPGKCKYYEEDKKSDKK